MSKSNLRWSRWMVLAALVCSASAVGQALNTTPEEEYRKSIKVDEDIQPLGETPFGEDISLYDGSLSFTYSDITLKGLGPDIRIERTFHIENYGDLDRLKDNAFGDWDINLPRISTIAATQQQVNGWMVEGAQPKQICQKFGPPPGVNGVPNDAYRHSWQPQDWWHGYQLIVAGSGSQDLLRRNADYPGTPQVDNVTLWPALTKQHWQVGCLGTVVNDPTRDAFLAVAPDGTRYRFDYLTTRWAAIITRPIDTWSAARVSAQSTGGLIHPMAAADGDDLYRQEASMFATRVTDRFGNWVRYDYTDGKLTLIEAMDGRRVRLSYESGTRRVSTITTQPDTAAARTWTYHYAIGNFGIPTLTSIEQPDGSRWTFNLSAISAQSGPNFVNSNPSLCSAVSAPTNVQDYVGSITHPSGLTGTFVVRPVKRGRSNVWKQCIDPVDGDAESGHALLPNAWYTTSIVSKTFSGAGMPQRNWSFQLSPSNESWYGECGSSCPATVWTDAIAPDGSATRTIFSNQYETESRLLRTELYLGAVGSTLVRSEDSEYANATQGPWPAFIGSELQHRVNDLQSTRLTPLSKSTTSQDGNWYRTEVTAFDQFAQPLRRISSNNAIDVTDPLGRPFPDKVDRTELLNNLSHWVLGLPTATYSFHDGREEEVTRNVYVGDNPVLAERWHFGRLAMRYAFWGDGTLQSFADGKCNAGTAYASCPKTSLSNYRRDIPQSIAYPDGKAQALGIDEQGQIAWVTNQAGATTSYAYDAAGRLTRVDYPSGDTVAWAPKVFRYDWVTSAERGIAANHWRRTVLQGTKASVTYFDAMLQPIANNMYGDYASPVWQRSIFDWKGRKTFQSYPVSEMLALDDLKTGNWTEFDVLGRVSTTKQDTENQQKLVTTTTYGGNSSKSVTDPRGNQTSFWYQVSEAPSYDAATRIVAPEGVVQTIKRDSFGNPVSIEQKGVGQPVTKWLAYDSAYRLCRTTEPESGSEIMDYDGAGNLAWSASGINFSGAGCGQGDVANADKTVRTYDTMNRVTSVLPPAGTEPSTYTYDALGNPATATLGGVGWTYGRNKLGLLTAEVLAVDDWLWTLQYDFDSNGALRSITYPDGDTIAYNPNALGQPTIAGGYASSVAYFPDGDVRSYSLGSGIVYNAEKDARNLTRNFTYGKAGVLAASEDFWYDANSNVTQVDDLAGNRQRSKVMGYDRLNRLTSAKADNLWGLESYSYDGLNNITAICRGAYMDSGCAGGTQDVYNYDGSNRLASISVGGSPVHSFVYDARGNTNVRDGQPLSFDRSNRLLSIPGKGAYTYDAAGRRVKKVTPSSTTYYAYNAAGQLMWELDPATRLGREYVYLGKKLIARKTESIDILKPSQVHTALAIVGVPRLATDGSTIDVTIDIANNGSRVLSAATSQYPLKVGYHLVDTAGTSTEGTSSVSITSDIPIGGHGVVTMHVAAAAVLGTGKRIRFSLMQEGVGWFEEWPGNSTVEAGPYSACPTTGTGNLCNNVTGLTRDQLNVTLTITSAPALSADGQSVLTTVDIANNGKVTLASAAPHPVNLGNHLIDGTGNQVVGDLTRASIPEIAPGSHAAVVISTPAAQLLGTGRRVQFELVQEGIAWFQSFGFTPLVAGPYLSLGGATGSITGGFTLAWLPIAGATTYTLREQFNGGGWTTVSNSSSTSWAATGRATGAYGYQVQACASGGCSAFGPTWNVTVLLPPPVPASASASAPVAGPVTLSWSASTTATRYVVIQQINGGGWTTVYDGPATSASFATPVSGTYVYQVQACNSSGCSANRQSNVVAITLPPTTAPGIAGGGLSTNGAYGVSWSGVAGATAYNLIESTNGGGWVQVQYNGAGSWSTAGRSNGTYVYQVQACNAGGCGPWSGQVTVQVRLPPATPSGVNASRLPQSLGKRRYQISWNAVADVTNYQIERTIPDIGTDYPDAGTTTSSTFLEDTGAFGQINMRVRACNPSGCSAWSDYVYVTF
jgi:YD repeat-containing protein